MNPGAFLPLVGKVIPLAGHWAKTAGLSSS